jgi:hypothetical protein
VPIKLKLVPSCKLTSLDTALQDVLDYIPVPNIKELVPNRELACFKAFKLYSKLA